MRNHPQWCAIQRRLEWAEGMSEIDKLRLLAGEMLRLNVVLRERAVEEALSLPPPRVLIPSKDPSPDSRP